MTPRPGPSRGRAVPRALSLAFAALVSSAASVPLLVSGEARAADTAASKDAAAARVGLAVVAASSGAGATDEAWLLAQRVYARAALRPAIDEARARVLVGEAPPASPPGGQATTQDRELGEMRAAIHGDDAASREVLGGMARILGARGLVVLTRGEHGPWRARVFVAEQRAFDAATYEPGAEERADGRWDGVVASLTRAYGTDDEVGAAPAREAREARGASGASTAASQGRVEASSGHRAFWMSPWFWGAVGAALAGAGAVYLTTRDNQPGTIHLQLQVPK